MNRSLIYLGNPLLRRKTTPVEHFDDQFKTLLQDLKDTLLSSQNGVALAAPQIGVERALFAIRVLKDPSDIASATDDIKVYINPKIVEVSHTMVAMEEGCLSIPGFYRNVVRPSAVAITAQDEEGRFFTEQAAGWHARILLHENDHLHGSLFIDRLSKQEKKQLKPLLDKMGKEFKQKA